MLGGGIYYFKYKKAYLLCKAIASVTSPRPPPLPPRQKEESTIKTSKVITSLQENTMIGECCDVCSMKESTQLVDCY